MILENTVQIDIRTDFMKEFIRRLCRAVGKGGGVSDFVRCDNPITIRGCRLCQPHYHITIQWNLDLRKPDLRKNLDLRKIVGTTDFLVHKLFDLRKIF